MRVGFFRSCDRYVTDRSRCYLSTIIDWSLVGEFNEGVLFLFAHFPSRGVARGGYLERNRTLAFALSVSSVRFSGRRMFAMWRIISLALGRNIMKHNGISKER
ncbi:hypothetical protein TNCV_4292011 [Trichonephila clavipes]|uniref:Uncharacterized protein n=1 Tax=Trichonephila clavipes TaxID=2585209 RepID=A0A8X6UVC8_TRICX|nr:hypothetical protein TNCV_4292011 [Trichonephila clavipes]